MHNYSFAGKINTLVLYWLYAIMSTSNQKNLIIHIYIFNKSLCSVPKNELLSKIN